MSDKAKIIPLPGAGERDAYAAGQERLTRLLVQHSLIDSFFNFTSDGKPYPFTPADQVLPHTSSMRGEYRHQNAALMFAIDGTMPRPLNKHFRLRASNRVTWRNLQRMAPEIDLSDFKAAHCQTDDEAFAALLSRLLPLDFALVAERLSSGRGRGPGPLELTHMHVKVERLTDNAIKDLGKRLGYIERRLFERGEDYVEALEAKFFEYYGFSGNASGRKGAAAMAAQLLAMHGGRFSVFVSGQEDCRLTVLSEVDGVTQYLLVQVAGAELEAFNARLGEAGGLDIADYAVAGSADGPRVLIYRVKLEHTAAARPVGRRRPDRALLEPWLAIAEEAIVPRPGVRGPDIPFAWAQV